MIRGNRDAAVRAIGKLADELAAGDLWKLLCARVRLEAVEERHHERIAELAAMPETYGTVRVDMAKQDINLLEAAARGTSEGLQLMLNVIAMLVSFVALVALLNGGFGAVQNFTAIPP